MTVPYTITRTRGQARLAVALQKRGWAIHGFTEGETETDEIVNIAQWHGYAEHPDFPNIVVVCGIDDKNKSEYLRPDWPPFRPTWVGTFYHLEDLAPKEEGGLGIITTGSGAYYTGELSQGMKYADDDADRIQRRAEKETKRKVRKAEKARKAIEKEQKLKDREAAKAAKEQARLDKAAAKAAGKKPAGDDLLGDLTSQSDAP